MIDILMKDLHAHACVHACVMYYFYSRCGFARWIFKIKIEYNAHCGKGLLYLVFVVVVRFIEVAATHYSHVSAAMTQTGKVLMWGQCRGQSITTPLVTRFPSTDDVFATFSVPPVTWRMYCVGEYEFFAQEILSSKNELCS